MAAPGHTVWGNIATGSKSTRQGRVGISVDTSSDGYNVYCTVRTWFWSMYSISDSNNTYSYNGSVIGSKNINHTVASGGGWSTSNQTQLGESSYTFAKGTSAYIKSFSASLTGIDNLYSSSVMSASTSITVPALASHTVSYNANGGSGAPSSQMKWYGSILILSNTRPTRTGYSFQGWATSSGGGVAYSPGGQYGADANITLYAVWKANTYTVSYNANGGSGAPSNQTKTYGVTLKLSNSKPTREYYNFLGWATSSIDTTATYQAGGNYTANAAVTLYAVWELAYVKPRINNAFVARCRMDETSGETVFVDDGTSALVSFDWNTDLEVTSITINWKKSIESTWNSVSLDASGVNGNVRHIIGSDNESSTALNVENTYDVRITVIDTESFFTALTIPAIVFPIDVYKTGRGVAFGKPAELENVADVGFQLKTSGGLLYPVLPPGSDFNSEELRIPNKYILSSVQSSNYICGDKSIPLMSGTGMLTVESYGPEGQTKQTIEVCHKTNPLRFERFYYQNEWGDWYEAGGYKSAITVGLNSDKTLGVVNNYTHVSFDKTIATKGGSLSLSDGYVKIGIGIQRIMVHAQIKINCGSTTGNRHVRICKSSDGTVSYLAWTHMNVRNASDTILLTFTSILSSVKEGDLIYVVFYTPDSTDVNYMGSSANGQQTYLTVESI